MTGTATPAAAKPAWKGFRSLIRNHDMYCCGLDYFHGCNASDLLAAYAGQEEEYIGFLAAQITAKLNNGGRVAVMAHLCNDYPEVVFKAFEKAGFVPIRFGDKDYNAFWNMTHGPRAIMTYIWTYKSDTVNDATIAKPGDKARKYQSAIPEDLLPKVPAPPVAEPVVVAPPAFTQLEPVKKLLRKRTSVRKAA